MYLLRPMIVCSILLGLCISSFAQEPLSPAELRENASYLAELKAAREKVKAQQDLIEQHQQIQARELEAAQRQLDAEKRMTAAAEKERDVEKARGDQLDALLKERNRRPSFGCRLKRFVTLGLGRCG